MDRGKVVGGIIGAILFCVFLVWVAILGNNAMKETQIRNETMVNLIIENERLKVLQDQNQ